MRKPFIVSLIALFLAESVMADVSGVWSLRLTTTDGESAPRASVTLKQDGKTLTGSCVIGGTDEKFTVAGEVTDDAVTWRCTSNGPMEASFSGTINSTGREMTGSWSTPAPARGTFKGSKSPGSMRPSPPPPELLFRDVTILSMTDEAPRRGSVLVRGDRIEYAGPTSSLPAAPNAQVVEGSGRFLIPGLIDMHTHVSKTRGSSLMLLVSKGVTTVRDLGGDHEELLAWRREIDAGTRIGPRLLIAGPYLESASNAARQHATPVTEMVEPAERTRVGVATPADAQRIIAGIAARGVDHLKIRTTTDRDTYLAIGAAAKRHGLALTGHFQPYSPDDLLASGQASLEHDFNPPLDERPGIDRPSFFRRLAAAGVAIVPTLVVLERLGTPDDAALKRRVADADSPANGKQTLSAYLRADWREQLAEQGPERRPAYQRLQENIRRDLREMRAAGVRILAGTDIGVLNVVPGESLHEELTLLVRDAGLSPLDALRAATSAAAVLLGRQQEIGTIAAGRRADLILLDADPLADIAHVSRISAVVLRGRLFDRGALTRLVDDVSGAPDVAANDWPRTAAR